MLDDAFRRRRIVQQRAGPAERLPVHLQIRDVQSESIQLGHMRGYAEESILACRDSVRSSIEIIYMAYNGIFDAFDCMHRYALGALRHEGYAQVL